MELFPVLPDELSGLTADELATLQSQVADTCDQIAAGEADLDGADPVEVMTQGVEIAEKLRAEEQRRAEKAKADAEKMEALKARLHAASDPEPEVESEDEPETSEPEAETPEEPVDEEPEGSEEPAEEPEAAVEVLPIAASTRTTPPARRSARSKPEPEPKRLVSITAAADIPGRPMGSELGSLRDIGSAMSARFKGLGRSAVKDEQVSVATVHADYPAERQLVRGDDQGNLGKIMRIRDQIRKQDAVAILAAGGLCAPVEPYYGLKQIATTARPVRDGMARFGAERGGIRFAPPPDISDFGDAITYITEADDASGGSAAIKATQEVTCIQFDEVDVSIVSHQLTFHNLTARAWPEQVDNAVANTMAAHARTAESALLDAMHTGSTQVSTNAQFGVSVDLPQQWIQAAAGFRSRHRTAEDYTLRLVAPYWVPDAIILDTIGTQFYRYATEAQALDEMLAKAGIVASWYLDTPSGAGQVFVPDSSNALAAFPSQAVWYLFDEGGWLFLDGGALELGLVRDSVLNALNEYTMFGETFEGAAFIGIESIEVTSDTCFAGATGSPDASVTC